MQKTAIVCVTNDLTTDQRVHKTCLTLQKCGFWVIERGRLLPDSLPIDRPYFILRKKHRFNKGFLFYAEFNLRLFLYLITAKVDLIFANDLDTLPAAFLAAKLRRKKLIYDTHEYFTETPELVNRKFVQSIWKGVENSIFPKLDHILTVNQSIADLYSLRFKTNVSVSRNIPTTFWPEKLLTREELGLSANKFILILQGTGINVQRGAEEAVLAMQYLDDCLLLVVGSGDVLPVLKEMVINYQLTEKVLFVPKKPFAELRQYTINSNLGVAIDKDTNLNYRFSLPNKIFDYMHSGIPVLASKLVEIEKVISKYNIGYFIDNHDPKHIAECIKNIRNNMDVYNDKRKNTFKAKEEYNWEAEERVLIDIIDKTNL